MGTITEIRGLGMADWRRTGIDVYGVAMIIEKRNDCYQGEGL